MKTTPLALAVFLLAFASTACASTAFAQKAELLVSAASSLTDVLTSLAPEAEGYLEARILFNFGASGVLRRQIEEGAPVDVFFSAASEDMDRLADAGLVVRATRRDLFSNAIVLIGAGPAGRESAGPVSRVDGLRDILLSASLLAIGNPDSVPAGRYAVQALTTYGLYRIVEKKLVLGGTARWVLQYVESGSAPLGIVFQTDALAARPGRPARVLFVFPADAVKTPIQYSAAVVAATKQRDRAAKLLQFFQGARAGKAFRGAGFIVP
jgi:molybdate transport system substrate-binding protein